VDKIRISFWEVVQYSERRSNRLPSSGKIDQIPVSTLAQRQLLNRRSPSKRTMDAAQIQTSTPFIDTHADTTQRFADEQWNFTDDLGGGHLNLATARAAGLSGEFFAIWAEPRQWRGRYAYRTLELIDSILEQVRRAPDHLRLCVSADDILSAHREHKFAVLMGIEGGHSIENSLALLRLYHRLGVRYMTLTWANSNDWADSSSDLHDPAAPHNNGLSVFGKEVIREMNRLGMIIDVSHVSDQTLDDVLATSTAPVIASHSSARALTVAPRNLTDDQLRAIASSGGAVMTNFYPAFIDERWRAAWNAAAPERQHVQSVLAAQFASRNEPVPYRISNQTDREFAARIGRPPLRSLIDHIDHIAKVAGIDHVGIGTDFDGISALPQEIDSAADLPKVADALSARGYGPGDLQKLLGGNLLRVFRDVEAAVRVTTPIERL